MLKLLQLIYSVINLLVSFKYDVSNTVRCEFTVRNEQCNVPKRN